MDGPLPAGLVPAWEGFLSRERTLDDLFAHPILFPLQRRREMDAMHAAARALAPRVVCEIGADKGGSVWAWCKALPTVEQVIACEVRGTPYGDAFEAAMPDRDFLWLDCGSRDSRALGAAYSWLAGESIDVLFLDGEKSAFYADFQAYLPFMSPRGVVFFHDVQERGPMRQAWERAARGRRSAQILDRTESDEALARQAGGESPASTHEGWLRHWRGASCGVGVVWLGGEP